MNYATDRINVKHWHEWEFYCTFSGAGTNGSTRRCEVCGATRSTGVKTKAVTVDGETYFRDTAINTYTRKGGPTRELGRR
ncbi:MAG: hypothetical protein OK454_00190 [Thaumarchaeota archaeon]|nr:hypothetical protein [Nitrososphaerota archaeon]